MTTTFTTAESGRSFTRVGEQFDTCLSYINGSGKFDGAEATIGWNNEGAVQMAVDGQLTPNVPRTAQLSFTVRPHCVRSPESILTNGIATLSRPGYGESIKFKQQSITVAKATATIALDFDRAPAVNQASMLKATVTPANAAGTVTFYNHGTTLGTGTVASGAATFSWTPDIGDAGKQYSLTATYHGSSDPTRVDSTALTGTIPGAPATPDLSLSPDTVTVGDPVTATVTTDPGNTVVITADGLEIHTGPADAQGIAAATYRPAAAGISTVTATAGNTLGASPAATKTVTVAAAETPSPFGSLGSVFGSLR